jgi:hypothetical protein
LRNLEPRQMIRDAIEIGKNLRREFDPGHLTG